MTKNPGSEAGFLEGVYAFLCIYAHVLAYAKLYQCVQNSILWLQLLRTKM